MRALPLLFVAALSVGCNAALGIDDYTFDGRGGAGGSGSGRATTSAASGGASTTGGSSSAGTGSGSEDCTNGIDDDDDGKIDCADSDCGVAGFTCAAVAPAGWTGPIVRNVEGNNPVPCGGGFPTNVVDGGPSITSSPVSCGSCACAPPVNEVCSLPQVKMWDAPGCSGAVVSHTASALGACDGIGDADTQSAKVAAPVVLSGSCAASGGAKMGGGAGWKEHVVACGDAVTGAGCADGGACRPASPAGYGDQACILAVGDSACPAGYPVRTLVYTQIDDTRDCAPCSCGGITGGCSPLTNLYPASGCGAGAIAIANDGVCHSVTHTGINSAKALPASVGGACTADGGTAIGSVAAAAPVTICCEP